MAKVTTPKPGCRDTDTSITFQRLRFHQFTTQVDYRGCRDIEPNGHNFKLLRSQLQSKHQSKGSQADCAPSCDTSKIMSRH